MNLLRLHLFFFLKEYKGRCYKYAKIRSFTIFHRKLHKNMFLLVYTLFVRCKISKRRFVKVQKAAREMGQRAFKKRLEEIKMSEYDAERYNSFVKSVNQQITSLKQVNDLRILLISLNSTSNVTLFGSRI